MIQIRTGVFETNSSSTHAIIIAEKGALIDPVLHFSIGEYGWENSVLHTPSEKASYLYTAACDIYCRDMGQELFKLLTPYGVQCILDEPAEFQFYERTDGATACYLDNGHLDHCGEAQEFVDAVLSDGDLLIQFLFSPQSFVVTTNDNLDGDEYADIMSAANVSYPHKRFDKWN